ncbi:MAG TPA: sugar ABC transporter ATP-binding protein [Vicinamibacteria bacterium]
MPDILEVDHVSKSFAGVLALRDVSLTLRAGEVHALVGENGAGKSTLVKIITGAHAPDSGRLVLHGRVVDRADPLLARSLGIAPIYQQPALFPDLTVAENMAMGLEPQGAWRRIDWKERRQRAKDLLARAGATLDLDARAGTLRMAEQQIVEIARALGTGARVLLMDEPTASLSDREAERLFGLIAEMKAAGVGVLYISHRLPELFRIADRVTVLGDGSVVETRAMAETTEADLIRLMVGREVSAVFPKRPVRIGPLALAVRGLGSRAAGIRGVSFELRAGEILGLAGLVGSGRTELCRVLFGLDKADEGEILLRGEKVRVASPRDASARGIAYVPEDRRRHGVIPEMSVAANTTLAVLGDVAAHGFMDFSREREIATSFVDRFAIKTPSPDTPVGNLSGGNQQKVALARWLAAKPSVLILDEPTQGVDVGAKAEIHRLMVDLADEGMAILMVSSELPEVLGMSDRIAVMHAGTLAGILPRAEATQEAILALALGHASLAGPALEAAH